MSLDLYIESNTPVQHKGTGVYIRENGETKELLTKEEVLKHFPDANPDDIQENIYEDYRYFHCNITHNFTTMAEICNIQGNYKSHKGKRVSLYDLMWHPYEHLNITHPTFEYLEDLENCYSLLLNKPKFFEKLNPKNGWGTYKELVVKTKVFIDALHSISLEFENYKIVSDT